MFRNHELTTARLHLVPCIAEHLEGLYAINSDPEVMRYVTGMPQTRSDTQLMIERVEARWAKCGYSWWTMIDRESGEIIGAGAIQNLRKQGTEPDADCPLEIAWRVRRDKWRCGYATEAAGAMAEFAFVQLRASTLYAVCHPENDASMGVMRKLGMRSRGLEIWYEQSVMTYEITAEDWRVRVPPVSPGRS